MGKLKAFILGIFEFRSSWSTHFEYPEIISYDKGRDLAHKLTLRKYEM